MTKIRLKLVSQENAESEKVLVAQGQVFQVADREKISEKIDQSWYRGQTYVYLKIKATEPEVLLYKYGSKDVVQLIFFIYKDGGPEHRTTFFTVKHTAIHLYKSLDLELVFPTETHLNV